MGAYCTRTICNVERGDPEHKRLLDRGSNMDKKQPDVQSPATGDTVPACDEPVAAYSTATGSGTTHNNKSRSQSKSKSTRQVPTPSMDEIQSAMDNLGVMFTAQNSKKSNKLSLPSSTDAGALSERSAAAQASKLPTLADDVSHLELANPFGSPQVSAAANAEADRQRSRHGLPAVPSQSELNEFAYEQMKKSDGARSPEVQEHDIDIAAPAAEDPSSAASALRDENRSTIVIHGDEDEEAIAKLTLQYEGSSNMHDDTNIVFSPPPGRAVETKQKPKPKQKEQELAVSSLKVKVDEPRAPDIHVQQQTNKTKQLDVQNSNQSATDSEQQHTLQQMDSNQLTGPWQSDYEPSDLEDNPSSNPGEELEDEQQKKETLPTEQRSVKDAEVGKKRRASKEETNEQRLRLKYDETTLNDESSSDDDSPGPEQHRKLIREESEWKWGKKDVVKTEKQMMAEYQKLKVEQEIAEMSNVMTYYRQQSRQ